VAELFTGKVDVQTAGSKITITLNGDTGDVSAGGNGQNGDLSVRDTAGTERLKFEGSTAKLSARSAAQVLTITLDGSTGDVVLRGVNVPGQGSPRIRLLASDGNIWLGGNGKDGDLVLFPAEADNSTLSQGTIHLDGSTGDIVHRTGPGGAPRMRLIGSDGIIWLGGNGFGGDLVLFKADGDNTTLKNATIHLDGAQGNIWLGGKGTDGDLVLFPSSATDINNLDQASIHLDGQAGDITLRNADCAEDFDVAPGETLEPGAVVMVDDDGKVRPTKVAYDRRVVGVVSGAGDMRPGIVLDRRPSVSLRQTVALMGKVYCRVDAEVAPVRAGDLLVPAAAPGYAMRAERCPEAFGAVIGKALGSLARGRSMVPMLVSLQ